MVTGLVLLVDRAYFFIYAELRSSTTVVLYMSDMK